MLTDNIVWSDGTTNVPADGSILQVNFIGWDHPVAIAVTVLTCIGIVIVSLIYFFENILFTYFFFSQKKKTITIFIILWIFRKTPVVMRSSPLFVFIILGKDFFKKNKNLTFFKKLDLFLATFLFSSGLESHRVQFVNFVFGLALQGLF